MKEEIVQVVETREWKMDEKCWEVYMDGASNTKGSGIGIVIFNIEESMRPIMWLSLR